MEERTPKWGVAANILSKQSRTADKVWSSSLGFGRGANNSSPLKRMLLLNIYKNLGPGLILRWAGHVARMGERRSIYRVLVEKPEGKNHMGDAGVGGRILLK